MNKNEIKYLTNIRKLVGRAINIYNLIEADDKVIVAVSGGKDSLVLLETLAARRKYIPINYDLFAVHIQIKNIPYEIDKDFFTSFCEELHVPFYCKEVDMDFQDDKSPCFICSRRRRIELFSITSELMCNKLALGHHKDDIIETLFMNMIFNGSISTMPPSLSLFDGEFDIIRPLSLLTDKEILRYAKIRQFPEQKKICPYSSDSKRSDIKKIIEEFTKMNKKAKNNIYNAMSNIHIDYLPKK